MRALILGKKLGLLHLVPYIPTSLGFYFSPYRGNEAGQDSKMWTWPGGPLPASRASRVLVAEVGLTQRIGSGTPWKSHRSGSKDLGTRDRHRVRAPVRCCSLFEGAGKALQQ